MQPLWKPDAKRAASSNLARFMAFAARRAGIDFADYEALYRWSIEDIPAFWDALWHFLDIRASRPFDQVVDDADRMPGARWFEGARLNFAQNLLRYRDEGTAILYKGESGPVLRLSYRELAAQTGRYAEALRDAGVSPGDRVAAYLPNRPETVIAMLAAASLGALWSSCSPDFGTKGVLDRFGQIEPKVLFAAAGYEYGGRHFDCRARLAEIKAALPSLKKLVLVPGTDAQDAPEIAGAVPLRDFLPEGDFEPEFVQLPAEHPLYIMYSSGTTGPPKCMVQGAAGILLNHLKELALHTDLRRDDRILYLTTCGWMMWNWLVSALALGATLVLYDGNPFYPAPDALWKLAEQEGISHFGTSARYLASLQQAGARPKEAFALPKLRAILSTGSPLPPEGFEYVYRHIKSDVQLASISGGTDLNGCFALGNPLLPVYAGELQCRGLGMAVAVFDEAGKPLTEEPGELVCTRAFPSMPLHFWNDEDGSRYRSAYFERYPGVWAHGDWALLGRRGGMRIFGRSDATLNPGGVRMGTGELYRVVESLPGVADSLAVGQRWKGDERVILFLKLAQGARLTEELRQHIRAAIREQLSPRHVPAKILAVADIPYTRNLKKVELAVRHILHGEAVKNRESLINPESLELYRDLPELSA